MPGGPRATRGSTNSTTPGRPLGDFAFRHPVPAYKHSMAQTLHLRGLLATDEPHPQSPRRPASDREIIATILDRIAAAMEATP